MPDGSQRHVIRKENIIANDLETIGSGSVGVINSRGRRKGSHLFRLWWRSGGLGGRLSIRSYGIDDSGWQFDALIRFGEYCQLFNNLEKMIT